MLALYVQYLYRYTRNVMSDDIISITVNLIIHNATNVLFPKIMSF